MKKAIFLTASLCLGLGVSPIHASKFNLEGMKELQETGKSLAEQAENLQRVVVLDDERGENVVKDNGVIDGKCIEVMGSLTKENQKVVMRKCKDEMVQRWRFDDQQRMVNAGGMCLGYRGNPTQPGTGLKTEKCQQGERQVWRRNDEGQLVNTAQLCLDGRGEDPAVRPCDAKQRSQKWGMFD